MKYIDAVMAAGFHGKIARKGWDGYSIFAPYEEYQRGIIVSPLLPSDANATDWVVKDCHRVDCDSNF